MRRWILLALWCSAALTLHAQSQLEIKGQIINKTSEQPLEFTTISLHQSGDSSLVTGGMTDVEGRFSLTAPAGNYYLDIQYIGFENKTIGDIQLSAENAPLNLGVIGLGESAIALDEVEVSAERSQMTFKLDKRVFTVGKDLTRAGASAADILDNVPSITVDVEGNVSLRGSQNVRILVNGKPSGLTGMGDVAALQRMQGDIIERIEVITNPSARYEAEGEAGIINIILKKNQEKGFNGSFGVNTGYPHNHGASYNLNYRQNDLNLFSNFGINYRRAPGGGFNNQRFFNEAGELTEARNIQRDQDRGGLGGNIQLGADWQMDERHSLTTSLLYRLGQDDNRTTVIYEDLDLNENLLGTTTRRDDEIEDERNIEGTITWRRSYEKEGHEWTADFQYIIDEDTERSDFLETGYLQDGPLIQRSEITENESNILFQTDYIHPVSETFKLEGGLRAALRTIENGFKWEEQDQNGDFFILPGFNDELEYTENVYAAYLIAAREWGNFSLQAGLRTEYSDITAALLRSDVRNDQNYLSLFPSASLSYQITEKHQVQASYSRRISRPYFRLLLPFSNFGDRLNLYSGNPNLQPEFTDAYELGYLTYLSKGSFMIGGFFRYTTDVIERVTLPNEDGTTVRRPINLSTRESYGLEANVTYDFFDWWKVNGDLNFFRALTNGTFEGTNFSADALTWTGRINTQLTFWDRLDAQLSFNYRGPANTTQGRRQAIYSLNIGLSIDVLQQRGTLTLSGRDIFNNRIRRSTIDLPQLQAESEFQWRRRQGVVLSFNYRLNQDKRRRGTGKDNKRYQDQRTGGNGI